MKKILNFGPELFRKFADCKTYSLHGVLYSELSRLVDHGFIADRACVWGESLDGHELAVVARTYCSDKEIDDPPEGLRCIRLPKVVMGPDDPGTAIAVVVTGATPAAERLLTAFTSMPADMLTFAISLELQHQGYAIALTTGDIPNYPAVKIIKMEE
jgi:hypothetical protein